MIYSVYTALLAAAVTAYAPAALARRLLRGVPLNLPQRFGYGGLPGAAGPRAWLHSVSVGETIAAAPLVEGLRRLYPELPLVVSTVTATGAAVVRERFGGLATHRYFPLDLPSTVRRTVRAIDPAFFICMETELWPNMLRELGRRGVPTMIANGRLSDRSFDRYRRLRPLMRRVLADVRVFGMRSDEDARRMIALGAAPERVVVTGNLKNDATADPPGAADLWRRLLGLRPGQRVWIAGSTHKGEEDAVLAAHAAGQSVHPDLALVLAPRHPERVEEVLALVLARGWRAVRRSTLPAAARSARTPVIVLDTVGELAQIYTIADAVFVGGSLVPRGGHNVLEPALRRKPVLVGPHTENFREAAALLVDAGAAVVVTDAASLAAELKALLSDPAVAAKRGEAGAEAVAARHGAVAATLELVERYLHPGARA
ncbi:MAG TPA: 3-deoxy-D-manno-octulosonic acid transferase [Methylomirabilota bacterium]